MAREFSIANAIQRELARRNRRLQLRTPAPVRVVTSPTLGGNLEQSPANQPLSSPVEQELQAYFQKPQVAPKQTSYNAPVEQKLREQLFGSGDVETLGGDTMPDAFPAQPTQPQWTAENNPYNQNNPLEEKPSGVGAANVDLQKQLADLMLQREKIASKSVVDDDSKWQNFSRGSSHAIRQVAAQGNMNAGESLGATIGALIGGGFRGLMSSKDDDERDKKKKLSEYDTKIQQTKAAIDEQRKQRKEDAEYQGTILDNQGKLIGNQTNIQKYKNLTNAEFLEAIKADDLITPEESTEAKTRGYEIPAYDKRQFNLEERGGTTFERPKLGGGKWSVTGTNQETPTGSLPIDEEKVLRDWRGSWQGKDEQPYRLTNKQIADIELAIKQGDVQRAQDIAKYNSNQNFETQKFNANKIFEAQKTNAANLNNWNKETINRIIAEAKQQGMVFTEEAEVTGLSGRIERYTAELNKISPDDTSEATTERRNKLTRGINSLQGKLDEKLGKSQAAKSVLETMQQNRPPRPEQINPVTIKTPAPLKPARVGRGRTYNQNDIDRVIRQ